MEGRQIWSKENPGENMVLAHMQPSSLSLFAKPTAVQSKRLRTKELSHCFVAWAVLQGCLSLFPKANADPFSPKLLSPLFVSRESCME